MELSGSVTGSREEIVQGPEITRGADCVRAIGYDGEELTPNLVADQHERIESL